MINNKFTKLAIATLLISTMENIVIASADDNALNTPSPLHFRDGIFQVHTPETKRTLQERIAEQNAQKTDVLKNKVAFALEGKKGRLPENVFNQLESTQLNALKRARDISANQLSIELKSAHERAILKSTELKNNLEIQKLIASLEEQEREALVLAEEFNKLDLEKKSVEDQIKKISAEKEKLAIDNELEKNILIDTLVETSTANESDLARLTSEHMKLQDELLKKTLAFQALESELKSFGPLIAAVKKSAAPRNSSASLVSEEKPNVVEQVNIAAAAQPNTAEPAKAKDVKGKGPRTKVNLDS